MRNLFPMSSLAVFLQQAHHRGGLTSWLRHLGAAGLFLLAIVDSSPIPTFGGTDILTAILAASRRNPWYEYAVVATAGSILGAYLTFRLARKAGESYLQKRFSRRAVSMLEMFHKWGTIALAVSTAVPLPFPTSLFFAAAGASRYDTRKFMLVVSICRALRYTAIAIIADYYGRHFVHLLHHPGEYWKSLTLLAIGVFALSAAAIALSHRSSSSATPAAPRKNFAHRDLA